MNNLAAGKEKLTRRKSRINFIINAHYVLVFVGSTIAFADINRVLTATGMVTVLYYFAIWIPFIGMSLNAHNYDIQKEIEKVSQEIEKNSTKVKAINYMLDNLRDSMLFDENIEYWRIIEKLDTVLNFSFEYRRGISESWINGFTLQCQYSKYALMNLS